MSGHSPLRAASFASGDYVGALHQGVREAAGWRRRAIASGAGLVSVLAFAPFFLSPVLFVTLPVLVWLIDGRRCDEKPPALSDLLRQAFADGWWWGFGFFCGGLFWIGEAFLVEAEKFAWALPFAMTLMPAGLALFFAAAAAGARYFWRPDLSRLLVFAVALGGTEWLRGHVLTGFPWNVIGYSLTYPVALMQSAALVGIYALTLAAALVFTAPLVAAGDATTGALRNKSLVRGGSFSLLLLSALALFGTARLAQDAGGMVENVKLRIVQPSVPQREKWQPEHQRDIFELHLALSRTDATGKKDDLAGITHLIWPEAAMPFRPLEHQEALDAIGALLPASAYLLAGGLRVAQPQSGGTGEEARLRVYNSLFAFGRGGGLAALYDKIHLVPFGEYLPLQSWLEAIGLRQLTNLRGGFSTGVTPRPLIAAGHLPPAGILICYEAIFPGEVVQGGERPGVLINVTNDGWFGDSTGPRQHFHQARVRAVEEGIPLVRAANNGISAVIDPMGRVLHDLGMNEKGTIDSQLPKALAPPPYARLGDTLFWLGMAVLANLAALARQRRTTP